MRHWKWVALVLCLSLIGFVASPALAQIKLNYSVFFPAPAPQTKVADDWTKEIAKRTDGKVQITIFPGGTLTPPAQCYDGVVKGLSDIGFSFFG